LVADGREANNRQDDLFPGRVSEDLTVTPTFTATATPQRLLLPLITMSYQ
jgi:hypothetical protein